MKKKILIVIFIILGIFSVVSVIILLGGGIGHPPKAINFEPLKNCTSDEECIIANSLNKCPYCDRDDICEEIDYSNDKYIAVNLELFSDWQKENCSSKEECLKKYGPLPLCPAIAVDINFKTKCIDNICEKVSN